MNNDNPTPEPEFAPTTSVASDRDKLAVSESAGVSNELNSSKSLTIWIVAIIALVTLSDQLTKHWALDALSDIPGKSISVFGDFLRWTLVYNEGGAMGTNLGGSTMYSVIGVTILLALGYYLWSYRFFGKVAIPLALIAGGAIGNLIDRFQLGKVVDWIDVNFFDIALLGFRLERWWTFNIADSAISVALVFLLWHSLMSSSPPLDSEIQVTETSSAGCEDEKLRDSSSKAQ